MFLSALNRPRLKDRANQRFLRRWAFISIGLGACGVFAAAMGTIQFGLEAEIVRMGLEIPLQAATVVFGIALMISEFAPFPKQAQEFLSDRDLDAVVAYAHELEVEVEAHRKALQGNESMLRYDRIDGFMTWMETQSWRRMRQGRISRRHPMSA